MPYSTKSLDKSVELSLCGLAPAQSQIDLFLDRLCARNKQRAANFNQSEEAMSRVNASDMFFMDATTDFRGNGYSKNRLICDCVGEPTHVTTTPLSNSLLTLLMLYRPSPHLKHRFLLPLHFYINDLCVCFYSFITKTQYKRGRFTLCFCSNSLQHN